MPTGTTDRIGVLVELEEALGEADPRDDAAFVKLLTSSLAALGKRQKDLAEEFTVTPSTVSRWVKGSNAPHPAMRPVVYGRLKELCKEHRLAVRNAEAWRAEVVA